MSEFRTAVALIGEENIRVLLNHVLGGNMLAQELQDFALLLGEHDNKPNIVFGKHI